MIASVMHDTSWCWLLQWCVWSVMLQKLQTGNMLPVTPLKPHPERMPGKFDSHCCLTVTLRFDCFVFCTDATGYQLLLKHLASFIIWVLVMETACEGCSTSFLRNYLLDKEKIKTTSDSRRMMRVVWVLFSHFILLVWQQEVCLACKWYS